MFEPSDLLSLASLRPETLDAVTGLVALSVLANGISTANLSIRVLDRALRALFGTIKEALLLAKKIFTNRKF